MLVSVGIGMGILTWRRGISEMMLKAKLGLLSNSPLAPLHNHLHSVSMLKLVCGTFGSLHYPNLNISSIWRIILVLEILPDRVWPLCAKIMGLLRPS
jgi:hypothetical protein